MVLLLGPPQLPLYPREALLASVGVGTDLGGFPRGTMTLFPCYLAEEGATTEVQPSSAEYTFGLQSDLWPVKGALPLMGSLRSSLSNKLMCGAYRGEVHPFLHWKHTSGLRLVNKLKIALVILCP